MMSSDIVPSELVIDKWSVNDLLDRVDYSFPGYTPSEDAFKFMNFMRLVLGEEPENQNSLAHYFLIDSVFQHVDPLAYYGYQSDVCRKNYIAVMCHREFSKLHKGSENIITPHGWVTMRDLQVGMKVINRYGKPTKVTHKSEPMRPNMYRMTLTDGSIQDIGEDHLNIVWMESRKPDKRRPEKVLTTKEIFEGPPLYRELDRKGDTKNPKRAYKYGIPLADPIEFEEATHLAIPPYAMGYGLANGAFKSGETSCHQQDITEITSYYEECGYEVHSVATPIGTNAYRFRCDHTNIYGHYKYVGSARSKYIPEEYLLGSVEQRLDLLRGLMDGDGTTGQEFGTKRQSRSHTYDTYSKSLSQDVEQLVRSLGGISYVRERIIDDRTTVYSVVVNMKLNPYKLKRKAEQWRPSKKILRSIVSLERIKCTEEGYCINVESECRSYLAGDGMIVTHNSVILGTMLALFMAYYGEIPNFGRVNFGGYIGNSVRGGVRQNMQTIASVYKDSDYLQDKFENVHFTDSAVKFVRHPRKNKDGSTRKSDRKESARTLVIEGYGAMAGPRGSRDGLIRPQFFIIDDVIKNAADSRSDIILSNISQMIEEDIGYALSTSGSFCIYIGTPFNLRDPLMNALIDGTWTPVVFPIAEKISLKISKEDFHGSWEDRHSYEKVMIKYKTAVHKGTLQAFMQEMMLRVASEEDRVVKDTDINWFSRTTVLQNGGAYNWYITTDFTTKGSKANDFSAMAVWAINNNGDFMLIDLVVQKLDLKDQYEKLFDLVRKYKRLKGYIEVGIETSGQQHTHIFAVEQLMQKYGEYFTIAIQKGKSTKGIMRTVEQGNKHNYFMMAAPYFHTGKMWFAEELKETADMEEALAEIGYITHLGIGSRSDDFIDVVSQLTQLNIRVPQYAAPQLPSTNDAIEDTNFHNRYWINAEIVDEDEGSSYIF